ncbi:ATP-binding cassette domain-containing protein [Streptomyces sp. NPDC005811]|uniref:ABC transporter permease subunit n=1 Tax=Streptomyces sp. NPDC005811 TaxID=3154565 RepID=UPI00340D3F89
MWERLLDKWRQLPESARAVLGGGLLTVAALPVAHALGLATPPYVLVLGGLIGLSYGLLAVCLVLVFRTSHVVNFAQPVIGSLGATTLAFLVNILDVPYWIATVVAVVTGFLLGTLVDFAIIRRLNRMPRVVTAAATIGVAVTLNSYVNQLNANIHTAVFPAPPGLFEFSIGPLLVTRNYTGLIIAAPVLVIALTYFMTRTTYGLAIRASASNPESAMLAAISPRMMTALAWGIGGICVTVLSIFFSNDAVTTGGNVLLGGSGILAALAAAAVAGMRSYSRAMVAGVLIGMVEQVLLWSPRYAGQTQTALLLILLPSLLLLRGVADRADPVGSWSALAISRPLPKALTNLWSVRLVPSLGWLTTGGAILWAGLRSDDAAVAWTTVILAMLIALSAGLIIALGGDLSLGQYAIAGVGAATAFLILDGTDNPTLGLLGAALASGAVSALLAYPALRVGGLTLTVVTASFAVTIHKAILPLNWLFGDLGRPIGQPVLAGFPFLPGRRFFLFAFVITALCMLAVRNVWSGSFGRVAIAARDNVFTARSYSIRTDRVRLQLFSIAGAVAGIAGALLVQGRGRAAASVFPSDSGAIIMLGVIVGGVSALCGGPLGALWAIGIPMISSGEGTHEANSLAAAYTGGLALIMMYPRGVGGLLLYVRDAVAVMIGRLHGVRLRMADLRGEGERLLPTRARRSGPAAEAAVRGEPEGLTGEDETPTGTVEEDGPAAAADEEMAKARRELPKLRTLAPPEPVPDVILEARGLGVDFGAITAVRQVDFAIGTGEIVGVIGANGAGKTTTFEMLSGFMRPTRGEVRYCGRDITRLSPERRADLGLVRSFQDAALFPTMQVIDVVSLALERQCRSGALRGLLGIERSRRRRREVAQELVDFFGLGRYFGRSISELSTGTRRIVELACLTSLQPQVLLLDEPSSGIAQREVEHYPELIMRMRNEFGMTIVIIEHDIPLVTTVSERIIAMDQGSVICSGAPEDVVTDEQVVDCYLGTRTETIHRSDLTVITAGLPGEAPEPGRTAQ